MGLTVRSLFAFACVAVKVVQLDATHLGGWTTRAQAHLDKGMLQECINDAMAAIRCVVPSCKTALASTLSINHDDCPNMFA
eukprot:422239-Amphidinium_carterae.3